MTNNEFKAWFEGFSEGIEKTPSPKQWAKIQEKIGTIDGTLSFTQYVTRYVDRPFVQWPYGHVTTGLAQAIPVNAQNTLESSIQRGQARYTTASSMIASIGRSDAMALG